jgi:hypothetical protein
MATLKRTIKRHGSIVFKEGMATTADPKTERREHGVLRIPIALRIEAYENYGAGRIDEVITKIADLCVANKVTVDEFTILMLDQLLNEISLSEDKRVKNRQMHLQAELADKNREIEELKQKLMKFAVSQEDLSEEAATPRPAEAVTSPTRPVGRPKKVDATK